MPWRCLDASYRAISKTILLFYFDLETGRIMTYLINTVLLQGGSQVFSLGVPYEETLINVCRYIWLYNNTVPVWKPIVLHGNESLYNSKKRDWVFTRQLICFIIIYYFIPKEGWHGHPRNPLATPLLAYGARDWNWNWPIRAQYAEQTEFSYVIRRKDPGNEAVACSVEHHVCVRLPACHTSDSS